MKLLLLPIFATLLVSHPLSGFTAGEAEFVRNGDLKEGNEFPIHWRVTNESEALISQEAISEYVSYESDNEGNKALVLKSTAGLTCVTQVDRETTLDPDGKYQLSAEVKVSGTTSGYLRIAVTPFEWVHYHCVLDLKNKADVWEKVIADFTPKAGETGLRIVLMARGFEGTASIRNISLVKLH